jgi:hypothetical protein
MALFFTMMTNLMVSSPRQNNYLSLCPVCQGYMNLVSIYVKTMTNLMVWTCKMMTRLEPCPQYDDTLNGPFRLDNGDLTFCQSK